MNEIVNTIRKLSDSKKNEDLKELSSRLDGVDKVFKKFNIDQIDAALAANVLSVQAHTLGYLYLLYYKGECFGEILDNMDPRQLILYAQQANQLMLFGDGYQIRMGGKKFAAVCQRYREILLILDVTQTGILALHRAVEKLRGSSKNVLTPAHGEFVLICIKSHNFRAALPILDTPIFSIAPQENGLEPLHYLTYHYYGGLAFTAMKQYEKALDMFQITLTCPASGSVISAVQIEAYKKYSLICLLVHGEFVALPSVVSRTIVTNCEKLCGPYVDLTKAYKKGSDNVMTVVNQHTETFMKDNSFGLVKQVLASLTKRKIQKLTNTYITLSLLDIAQQANLETKEQAEAHLLDMIENGDILAKISQKDGMLSFLEDPEDYDTTDMVAKIDAKICDVMTLSSKLEELNNASLLNPMNLRLEAMDLQNEQRKGVGEDDQMRMAMEASLRHH